MSFVALASALASRACHRSWRRWLGLLGLGLAVLLSPRSLRAQALPMDGLGCRHSVGVSRVGGAGIFDLPVANPGCPWHLRTALWLGGFVQYGYLLSDDRHQQLGGAMQIDATLGSHVETWLQVGTRSSRNQRPSTTEPPDSRPTLTLGRSALGVKLHSPFGRYVHLAVQPQLRVHSGPYDFGPNLASLDGGIDVLLGVDLARVSALRALPLRLSLRLGYLHDRSSETVSALDCMAQGASACLATRLVYGASYDIGQPRVEVGLGMDLRLSIASRVWLMPAVTYALSLVTGEGDAVLRAQLMSQVPAAVVAASEDRVAQQLSLGARLLLPWLVSIDLGMQVALSSWGYIMGTKLPQVAGFGALSFAFDLTSTRREAASPDPTERPSTGANMPPTLRTQGSVRGVVRDRASRVPLPGAIVRFVGVTQNALLTDARGEFESGPLPAGSLEVEASRSDHLTTRTTLIVRAGEEIVADLDLETAARALPARVLLSVRDEGEGPIRAAIVSLTRAGHSVAMEAAAPSAQPPQWFAKVAAGAWRLRVDAAGYLSRELLLVLNPDEERQLNVRLLARPRPPRVALAADEILLAEPLQFVADSKPPQITPGSQRQLDEVIDLLIHHPELHQLRIEAASSDGMDAQLIAIREYLIQGGIAPERVRAGEQPAGGAPRQPGSRILLRLPR